jgi:hypothetical protein
LIERIAAFDERGIAQLILARRHVMARVFSCVAISLILSACAAEAPRAPVAAVAQAAAVPADSPKAVEKTVTPEPPKSILACTGLPLAGRKCGIPNI